MNNTERFSNRVENYVKYHPSYPAGIIPFLEGNIGLNKQSVVADIGSGTGISCEPFLKNGNTVFGVEPNDEMRHAAEEVLSAYKNFISVKATAEHTALPDHSVDFIVCAQAFHWFDKEKCKAEFARILKPNGRLVLMWNERLVNSDFLKAYENALLKYSTDYAKVDHRNVNAEVLAAFFAPQKFEAHSLPNAQFFNMEGLKGRLLSSSYCPTGGENFEALMRETENIFEWYKQNGQVYFAYETKLYFA